MHLTSAPHSGDPTKGSSVNAGSAARMRSSINAFGDPQDHERQLQQDSSDESADEEREDSNDQVAQPFRGRLLITEHDASHDHDSAEKDGDNVQQLCNAARELVLEREVEEPREEILFIGHAASWAHDSFRMAGVMNLVCPYRKTSQV